MRTRKCLAGVLMLAVAVVAGTGCAWIQEQMDKLSKPDKDPPVREVPPSSPTPIPSPPSGGATNPSGPATLPGGTVAKPSGPSILQPGGTVAQPGGKLPPRTPVVVLPQPGSGTMGTIERPVVAAKPTVLGPAVSPGASKPAPSKPAPPEPPAPAKPKAFLPHTFQHACLVVRTKAGGTCRVTVMPLSDGSVALWDLETSTPTHVAGEEKIVDRVVQKIRHGYGFDLDDPRETLPNDKTDLVWDKDHGLMAANGASVRVGRNYDRITMADAKRQRYDPGQYRVDAGDVRDSAVLLLRTENGGYAKFEVRSLYKDKGLLIVRGQRWDGAGRVVQHYKRALVRLNHGYFLEEGNVKAFERKDNTLKPAGDIMVYEMLKPFSVLFLQMGHKGDQQGLHVVIEN